MRIVNKDSVIRKARDFVQSYNPEGIVPFPFAEAVEQIQDLKLTYIETTNAEISGAIYLEGETYRIVINSAKPLTRQYFTIAHEIGHYILHKDKMIGNVVPGFVDFGSLDSAAGLLRPDSMPTELKLRTLEQEANTFAAELVMPEDKVREFYRLNGDIKETADAFKVSAAAMAVRLEKLRLI